MARMVRGILGGLRGKIGNVVGSNWKGIDTLRTKPISVANPKTAAQVTQRNSLSGTVAFAKRILVNFIKPLWDRFAQQQSGYNAFVSANIGAFPNGVVTRADLVLAQGSLTPLDNVTVDDFIPSDVTITVNWDDNSGTGTALANDEIYAIAWNVTKDLLFESAALVTRDAETLQFAIGANHGSGDEYVILITARRADGTLVATSTNVEKTEI